MKYGTLHGTPVIDLPDGVDGVFDFGGGSNSQITVTFGETVGLATMASPPTGGTVTGSGRYLVGSPVAISAVAAEGFRFVRWSGADGIADVAGSATSVLMSSGKSLIAEFEAVDPYQTWAAGRGLQGDSALKSADPDGDGVSNGIEFLLGFDPADSRSTLKLSIEAETQSGVRLVINRVVPTGTFRIEWTTSLADGWKEGFDVPIFATAENHPIAPPPQAGRCFYRLKYSAP